MPETEFTGRAGQLASGKGEYQEDGQGNRDWFYTCGCHLSSGGGSNGTFGSAYSFNPCEEHMEQE